MQPVSETTIRRTIAARTRRPSVRPRADPRQLPSIQLGFGFVAMFASLRSSVMVSRPVDNSTARIGIQTPVAIDAAVKLATVLMLLEERVERLKKHCRTRSEHHQPCAVSMSHGACPLSLTAVASGQR
jgi:hypothetical protein